jgi:hypothetical protein
VQRDHARHHGADRGGFALVAGNVARLEPVETGVGIVGAPLLRQQQRETMSLGQPRPAGAAIILLRTLSAAMQRHDQRAAGGQMRRHVGEHPQIAGVVTEGGDLVQAGRGAWRVVGPRAGAPAVGMAGRHGEHALPVAAETGDIGDRSAQTWHETDL